MSSPQAITSSDSNSSQDTIDLNENRPLNPPIPDNTAKVADKKSGRVPHMLRQLDPYNSPGLKEQ